MKYKGGIQHTVLPAFKANGLSNENWPYKALYLSIITLHGLRWNYQIAEHILGMA